ncbi:VanW family protein [Kibdelosporangium phytohabitans]|uniref:Vanomycin resistance protein VanB n=1 Tax=Kibdelosporangium phytohabitans TaxID=860235 RepID=A0A0N9I7W7_9PSEU|nr:VanW family protein [Kibdelosporangium phytohabitans]ALG14330.1 vanomycin resistance protein VanB [Kibdelosporangium phytohabitans]MBE1466652.1 vancomycin resistance protein YoaR [Kibdelosporangium phytohabitans]
MPEQHHWPESHSEQTDVLPAVRVQPSTPAQTPPHEVPPFKATSAYDEPTARWADEQPEAEPAPDRKKRNLRKTGLAAGAVVGVLGVLYLVDVLVSQGNVPRGVTVAGVEVGGMTRTAAEKKLREQIEPRLNHPVQLKAGDLTTELEPAKAGLTPDWAKTLDAAGEQPINPVTRLTSFFSNREVGFTTQTDQAALTVAVDGVRGKVDQDPVEGSIKFDGTTPAITEAKQGRKLDQKAAADQIVADWVKGVPIELPVAVTPVKVAPDAVKAALEQAKIATSGPIVLKGEGKDATLTPPQIAAALRFEPVEDKLVAKVDPVKVAEAAGPQLKSTEKEGKDATIVFEGGKPTVHPSEDGKTVNWEPSLVPFAETAQKQDGRELKLQYTVKPAKVTTEQANALGIKEVIGEFTTNGFASDSGVNIRMVAQKVNGAIVKPGDTFSLNGFTGPRGAAQGYVEAGVIKDGAPGREVGGGISQFATTLYNASYFAGLKNVEHKEHSYYISRYHKAREATVFQDHGGKSVIDLKFANDAQTGIAIQTAWTPKSITVKIWGTKRYQVDSVTGPDTNPTPPTEKAGPAQNCSPSNGAPGFTVTDTRVIKDLNGREVRRENRTVKYNPQPKITCPAPPA